MDAKNAEYFKNLSAVELFAKVQAGDKQAMEFLTSIAPKQAVKKVVGHNLQLSIANNELERVREENRVRMNDARNKAESLARVDRVVRWTRMINQAQTIISEYEVKLAELKESHPLAFELAQIELEKSE